MGESKKPIDSFDAHRLQSYSTSIKPVPRTSNISRDNESRTSTMQPSQNTSAARSDRRKAKVPSQDMTQINTRANYETSKITRDAVRNLNFKLEACEMDLHAHRTRYEDLQRTFDTMQVENDQLKQELGQLIYERNHHQHNGERYKYVVEQVFLPYAQERRLEFDDRTRESLDFVILPMLQETRDSVILHGQMQVLQQRLLSKERRATPLSDEQFETDFRGLVAQIKTLSRLLRLKEGIDVVETLGTCRLASGATPNRQSGRFGKKLFIESWIWSNLMQTIFRTPFSIFETENNTVSNLWSNMFGSGHSQGWPRPSLPCETWRYTTMEHLIAAVDTAVITQGMAKAHYSHLEQHTLAVRDNITSVIATYLALVALPIDFSLVGQIINKAFVLAMHMSLQRSRLQITYPDIGKEANPPEIESMPPYGEDDVDNGIVAFVINPGLTKWGDVHGKAFDYRYDIVPARVQLEAGVSSRETGVGLQK
jgi:hypothetical protein